MIPMDPAGSPAPPNPGPRRRSRSGLRASPAVAVPVGLLVGLLVAGMVMSSVSDSPERASVPTNPTDATEASQPDPDRPARGSGELNTVLVESIVQIVIVGDDGDCSVGSGSVIGDELHVLTNHHVVDADSDCVDPRISIRTVETASGRARETYLAEVVVADVDRDIAILKIEPVSDGSPALRPLVPVSSDVLGQELTVVGYPAIGGDTPTVSRGILAGFIQANGVQWIKTDALVSGGNSGGAALDEQGRLLGVPTMYSESESGEVVDCRNAADTNGDGRIDDRDQCVSTGGTLGLVAPVETWAGLARSVGLKIEIQR